MSDEAPTSNRTIRTPIDVQSPVIVPPVARGLPRPASVRRSVNASPGIPSRALSPAPVPSSLKAVKKMMMSPVVQSPVAESPVVRSPVAESPAIVQPSPVVRNTVPVVQASPMVRNTAPIVQQSPIARTLPQPSPIARTTPIIESPTVQQPPMARATPSPIVRTPVRSSPIGNPSPTSFQSPTVKRTPLVVPASIQRPPVTQELQSPLFSIRSDVSTPRSVRSPVPTPSNLRKMLDTPPYAQRGRQVSSSVANSPVQPPRRRMVEPREFFQPISIDSIESPKEATPVRGRYVGDEPMVKVSEEEMISVSPKAYSSPYRTVRVTPPQTPQQYYSPPSQPQQQPPQTPQQQTPRPQEEEPGEEEDLSEAEQRLMLIARLKILKRSWPDINMTDFEKEDARSLSVKQLRKIFNLYKARVFAEETSTGYKKFLIAGFVFVEVLCVKVLKIDMSGFTMNQIMAMNSYQDMMLELAEQYGSSYKSQVPIELRLMFMMAMNAVIFFVLKLVLGDANSEMSKAIASALGGGKCENAGMAGMVGSVLNMLTGGPPAVAAAGEGEERLKPPAPMRRRRKEEVSE